MTNYDFIKRTAKKFKVSQKSLQKYLDIVELALKTEIPFLEDGEKLKVMDITFEKKTWKERIARNPKTNTYKFSPSKTKIKLYWSSDWRRIFKLKSFDFNKH